MSDVAVRKIALRAGLPLPPQGHWNRVAAGKKSAPKPALPPRGASAANSSEGKAAAQKDRAERIRLLYVGATRARDYLVLIVPQKDGSLPWLDELTSATGVSVVVPPPAGATSFKVEEKDHACRAFDVGGAEPPSASSAAPTFCGTIAESVQFRPMSVKPSAEGAVGDAKIVEEIDLGARLPFAGAPDMTLVGEALHRFLAADDPAFEADRRLAMATRLLAAWGVIGLDPRDVVTMSNRFWKFVADRWPGASLRREAPIVQIRGNRTLKGRLDAVVETSDALVIDHKSFPGGRPQWIEQARKYAGQLRTYRDAISPVAAPRPVHVALHLPVSGWVLFVE